MASFNDTLHRWAAQQLRERSQHTGPFTITSVTVGFEDGVWLSDTTIEDAYLEVEIQFTHTGCNSKYWFALGGKNVTDMLNELLATEG